MKKPLILCLIQGREHLLANLFKSQRFDFIVNRSWEIDILDKINPSLILSIGEADYKVYQIFRKAKEVNIPTLNIQDGISEFRDIWENPYYSFNGNYFNRQFMIADKIACHGFQQAALFSSWGMQNQVEIVGVPWFEKFKDFQRTANSDSNILILTANKPAFTAEHYQKLKRSFIDLNECLSQTQWKPIWRCRGDIVKDLDFLKNDISETSESLFDILKRVKAVISTPSTTIVEAMLAGIPVAKIDYTNSPSYITTAWNINAKDHILPTLLELSNPTAQKLNFQEICCNWIIDNSFKYTEKLETLIERMIEYGKNQNGKINLPKYILEFGVEESIGRGYTMSELFPKIKSFWNNDINELRVENQHLRIENAQLKNKLKACSPILIIKNMVKKLFK